MVKHTPGPWMLTSTNPHDGWEGWEIQAQPSPIARGFTDTIASCTGPQSNDKRWANARLIAAAPDMFEALANLENDDGKAMPPSAWKLVQDALAKARGES